MTSKPIYFCVYRITNLVEKKHYYGYKSSSIHPSKVIGITYFSSSRDKEFISDQKENPQNYKYKIVQIFGSKEEALAREIRLHNKFDVAVNPNFYHKAKQTSSGFDTTGKVTVKNKDGDYLQISIEDKRLISGELVGTTKGLFLVSDKDGNIFQTTKKDPRYISGELVGIRKGYLVVKDSEGKTFSIKKTDPRYLSGELKHVNYNMIAVKDKDGNYLQVSKTDPRFISGELVSIAKDTFNVRNTSGEIFKISLDDPKYLSGELVGILKNKVIVKDKNDNSFSVVKNDPRFISGELVGITKNQLTARDHNCNLHKITKNDPRFISGELQSINSYKILIENENGRKWIYKFQLNLSTDKIIFERKKETHLITPWGEFIDGNEAEASGVAELKFNNFYDYCVHNEKIITRFSKLIKILGYSIIGKTYKDLGFGIKHNW